MRNILKKYIGPAILSTVIFAVITGLVIPRIYHRCCAGGIPSPSERQHYY